MQAISRCHSYFIFHFLLKFWNLVQEGWKLQKLEYFKSYKNSFQLKLKAFHIIFEALYVGVYLKHSSN